MKIIRKKQDAPAIPLCSTADIAFLLLIFFLVLAKAANESTIDLRLAKTSLQVMSVKDSVCTISIDRNKDFFVNGMPCSLGDLRTNIEAYLGDRPAGKRKVLVKIHDEVPASVFEEAFLVMGEANAEIFRVIEPKDKETK